MMKKTEITWDSPSGDKITAKIIVEKCIINNSTLLNAVKNIGCDLDSSWDIQQETHDYMTIQIYCNDTFITRSNGIPSKHIPLHYAKNGCFAKINNVGIRKEQYNEIMNFITKANKSMLTFDYLRIKGQEFKKELKELEDLKQKYNTNDKNFTNNTLNGLCHKCGTFCYGDCEANFVP